MRVREDHAILGVIALLVGIILYSSILLHRTRMRCLAKGYPQAASITYCVKRVNQTDVVARLDTLQ